MLRRIIQIDEGKCNGCGACAAACHEGAIAMIDGTAKLMRALLLNALSGLAVLALVDITTRFTGVHIPVNQWTAGISAGLGVPAVCLFLVLPVMFK